MLMQLSRQGQQYASDRQKRFDTEQAFFDIMVDPEKAYVSDVTVYHQRNRSGEKRRAHQRGRDNRGSIGLALLVAISIAVFGTAGTLDRQPKITTLTLQQGRAKADEDAVTRRAIDASVCSPYREVEVCSLQRQLRQEWLDRHDPGLFRGRPRLAGYRSAE